MVQHSFWHQRVVTNRSEPVCPTCRNPVQFVLTPVMWRCHLGHEVHTPIYEVLPPQPCPFPALHTPPTL